MNHTQFMEAIMRVFANCANIARGKSLDYSGNQDNFASFKVAELVSGVTVTDQLKYEIGKKLSRINRLTKQDQQVKGESVLDSIDDAINYLAILRLWLDPQPLFPNEPEIPESKE